jgi:hypothetical protein
MYRVRSLTDVGPGRPPLVGARPRGLLAVVALAAAAVLGCGDPGEQAGPTREGPVRVTLVSPNGNEGAALFELPIDGIVSVRAPVGALLESQTGGRRQVAVIATQPTPIVLELTIADQTKLPEVKLLQVSGPDDQARALTAYRVQVEVPK